VLTRAQMFGPVGHRGATWQKLRMGMDGEGRLTALHHHCISATSSFEDFLEPAANASLHLYASPAILAETEGLRLDIGTPGPMRAPGEASGSAALEAAIDEAAEACGMDPLEFRLANYAETERGPDALFVQGAARMLREGAKAFGWAGRRWRHARCAMQTACSWAGASAPPSSPARISRRRRAPPCAPTERRSWRPPVSTWARGPGPLSPRSPPRPFGLDPDQVEFHSGVSSLPDGGVAGGSGHTASAGLALHNAGETPSAAGRARQRRSRLALFGVGNIGVFARGGRLHRRDDESRSERYVTSCSRRPRQTRRHGTHWPAMRKLSGPGL